jgi:hypothetical protein
MSPSREIAQMPDGRPVRLTAGAHSSPQEGVCVVELASVFAEERFSDRPRCVCPVIGAFLRGWNDRAPHAERQRLGPYAARIVGSRSIPRVTRERRDLCLEWSGADLSHGRARRLVNRSGMRVRIAVFCGMGAALRLSEGAGDYASRVAAARGDTESAFGLLDALLAIGADPPPDRPPSAFNGNGSRPVSADTAPTIRSSNGDQAAHRNGSAPQPGARVASSRQATRFDSKVGGR